MQKKSIVFMLALLWCAASALAQQPQSPDDKPLPGKVQRLNQAPVNPEILKVTLPHVKEAVLPNGLSILVLERHKLPTVNFALWIKSGALTDPADQPGLASFTADMLRDGTLFNDTATTEIYSLSLHAALPIWMTSRCREKSGAW